MTDPVPYTAEELEAAIGNLSCFDALPLSYAVEMRGSDCLRLAATLRGFQRVLAENNDMKAHEAKWADAVERQRKTLDRYREERGRFEAEVATLREDKERLVNAAQHTRNVLVECDQDYNHPRFTDRHGTGLRTTEALRVLRAAIDAARSGAEG